MEDRESKKTPIQTFYGEKKRKNERAKEGNKDEEIIHSNLYIDEHKTNVNILTHTRAFARDNHQQ